MRRIRDPRDLYGDPSFLFRFGQLIGYCEMLSRYLQVHGDEQAKQMGERGDRVLEFFFTTEKENRKELTK